MVEKSQDLVYAIGNMNEPKPKKQVIEIDRGNLIGTVIAVLIAIVLIAAFILGSKQPNSQPNPAPSNCERATTC